MKKLITSALPYVNNSPHLGNIIGCVLSADVYARFCRSRGYETLYICGTDEYGTATETSAQKAGVTPKELCDKFFQIHEKVYAHFNCSFDAFGRTSDPVHTDVVQDMFKHADAEHFFIEQKSEQVFCQKCDRFLADRFVEGTCPHCKYTDARGDQCESCGKLLTPTELLDPECFLCHEKPTLKETSHLYLDLEKLSPELKNFHAEVMKKGEWTNNASTTSSSWIEAGLKPRPITRDLKWGVSVPKPGFEKKVFYVWFDAPIGYVSITKKAFPQNWESWWKNPKEVQLYQFMAKDNIPFHSIIFPAVQLSTRENWTKVHHLNATEYLNYENAKFSKSKNHGVFGTDVVESDIPVDLWRYYLLSNRPEKQDSSFTWDEFFEKVNKEFIDILANFVNRTLVFLEKNYNGKVEIGELLPEQMEFKTQALALNEKVTAELEHVEIKDALKTLIQFGKTVNKFFQDEEPWFKVKTDPKRVHTTVSLLTHSVKDLAIMLEPFMPDTSKRILKSLGLDSLSWKDLGNFQLLQGKTIGHPELLFKKLDPAMLESLKAKFSGEKPDALGPIDLRVGKILSVEKHPAAENLLVEKIDLGEEMPRTIVSGLAKFYQPEQLVGKSILVVANLKPAKLRGILSEGMVLCVDAEGSLELLEADAAPGTAITTKAVAPPTKKVPLKPQIDIKIFGQVPFLCKDFHVQGGGAQLYAGEKELVSLLFSDGPVA